jgi:hypothetical protein
MSLFYTILPTRTEEITILQIGSTVAAASLLFCVASNGATYQVYKK